jgi:hypothetical protein
MALRTMGQGRPAAPWYRAKWVGAGGVLMGSAAIVAAAAIAAGAQLASSPTALAGPKPTATVSGVADPGSANSYLSSIGPAWQLMQSSLQNLANAVQAADWTAINTSCQQLAGAAQRYQASLPSPDSRVTPRIQSAADNINQAVDVCMTWVPGSQPDVAQLMSHVEDATADLRKAKTILAP